MKKTLFVLGLAFSTLVGGVALAANRQIAVGKYTIKRISVYHDKSYAIIYLDRPLEASDHPGCKIPDRLLLSNKELGYKNALSLITAAYLTKQKVGFGVRAECHATSSSASYPPIYRVDFGDDKE